jgi:UDP-glucose 6-dehydrogenase
VKISLFELGYVESVSTDCFSTKEHNVVGADPNYTKVDLINLGSNLTVVTKKLLVPLNMLIRLCAKQTLIDTMPYYVGVSVGEQ